MREAERLLKSQGYSQVAVWVFEDNKPALLFYDAIGLTPDGVRKIIDAVGAPVNCVRYGKNQ
jgi:ribosomal protein S18 acetylase RimI-like enzyme